MITTLMVALAGLLPTYIIRFSLLGIPINLFEILVITVFISAIWNKKSRHRLFSALRALPRSFTLFACLFLLSAVVSTLFSPVLRSSLGILKGWVVVPMLFGLLIHTADRKKVIHSLIMSGLVVALLGISQIDGFGRIQSIYDVPNSLALFLSPVFFIAFWVGMQQKNRFYQLASLIMLITIIWTQSFGAVVAIAGTALIGFLFTVRFPSPQLGRGLLARRREGEGRLGGIQYGLPLSALLLLMLFILIFAFFTLSGRIQYLVSPLIHQNTSNSATVRLQLWDIGVRLIQKNPILGIGLGQFEPAYQAELHALFATQANEASEAKSYKLIPEFVFRDPHNWIISFWLNVGVVGLVSFIGLNIVAIRRGGGRSATHQHATTLALISILIFGLFDTIYWKNDLSALWWLLTALSTKEQLIVD
ncbi:MAG: O-antigen ligase family protein [bacterium]|nr:O-antigen ligase family protein [bacterium]